LHINSLVVAYLKSGDTSKRKQLAPKHKAARFNPFHETLIKLPLAHSQHDSVSAAN
jgi:hypothetical protein